MRRIAELPRTGRSGCGGLIAFPVSRAVGDGPHLP